jgi:hypothetical protein
MWIFGRYEDGLLSLGERAHSEPIVSCALRSPIFGRYVDFWKICGDADRIFHWYCDKEKSTMKYTGYGKCNSRSLGFRLEPTTAIG